MANKKSMNQQKRFQPKLHVKKGDKVRIIAGAHKGKEGEILRVLPEQNRAVVDNVNLAKKHVKPTQNDGGGIREIAVPLHLSNLMILDPKTNEPTRIGRKEVDGKLVRYSKKTGEIIN